MNVITNGTPLVLSEPFSLRHLLARCGMPEQTALVELNGEALRREEWESVVLAENDCVEILQISAGG